LTLVIPEANFPEGFAFLGKLSYPESRKRLDSSFRWNDV